MPALVDVAEGGKEVREGRTESKTSPFWQQSAISAAHRCSLKPNLE